MVEADVVVVGGGPAGSLAARVVASAGHRVVVLEADRLPRDKPCGDALVPDALDLLAEEGLLERVRALGHPLSAVRLSAPGGDQVRLAAPLLTVRREQLDLVLSRAAVAAGAEVRDQVVVDGPLRGEDGVVVGVRATTPDGPLEVHAPLAILATGGSSRMLESFGVCARATPSAIGLRGYYRIPGLEEDELVMSYERPVMPGYGWIFPLGDGVANVGCGVYLEGGKAPENLQCLFARFTAECAYVRARMAGAELLEPLGEAPLRCAFEGARPVADGLLVAGEAVGTTYSLTGEGIGKAMASGRFAGHTAVEALEAGRFDARFLGRYPDRMRRAGFPARFGQYQLAQRWVRHTWVVNLLARRARHNPRVRSLLEGILREDVSPEQVLSFRGLLRSVLP